MAAVVHRYLGRELLVYWLAFTLVLWLVLVAARLSLYLGQAAGGQLPATAVIQLLAYKSVGFFVFLMPLGLFLGLLFLLGRLNRDFESLALATSGVGPRQWYRAIAVPVLAITLLVALLSMGLVPYTAQQGYALRAQAEHRLDVDGLEPGRLHSLQNGRWLLFAERAGPRAGTLGNLFVHSSQEDRQQVLVAEYGFVRGSEPAGGRYLVLRNGHRYDGVAGQADYRVLRYREYVMRMAGAAPPATHWDAVPSSELWRNPLPAAVAEWHARLARPLTVLVLALVAIPLGRFRSGTSRYYPLWLGVLVFTLYFNLLGTGQLWLEQARLPYWLGLWWVHLLILLLFATGSYLMQRFELRRSVA